jgi:hypothetical protein
MAATIYNRFMPDTNLNKPRIREESSGLAIQTIGIPCIHIILRAERGSGLSVADFHPHWHLPASIPAAIPALTWNPPKAITRGRPPASSARQAISQTISQTQRSTQRSPSQFESIEQQIVARNHAFENSRRAASWTVSQASQASQLSQPSQLSGASGVSGAGWEGSEDEGPRRSGRAPRTKRRRTDETSQGETTETDR